MVLVRDKRYELITICFVTNLADQFGDDLTIQSIHFYSCGD